MQNDALAYFTRRGRPIVATSSALGGPIAVIRISGENLEFLQTLIGKFPAPNSFKYSSIQSFSTPSHEIDRALVLYFKAPNSFTGEDVIEIQGHGIFSLVEEIISNVVLAGAERALPGEFSFRAYLNSKMSLQDAESLQIALSTEGLSGSWASQLVGSTAKNSPVLLQSFLECVDALQSARGRIEAAIDFPEAETEQAVDLAAASVKVHMVRNRLNQFLSAYYHFCRSAGEPRVVIIGAPNVGKSSLLNALVGGSRALVSETAGTTRDVVETRLRGPRGEWFRLLDTAGIREVIDEGSHSSLEKAGIELGLQSLQLAQVVVWLRSLIDLNSSFQLDKFKEYLPPESQIIELFSFSDKAVMKSENSFNISNLDKIEISNILSLIEEKITQSKSVVGGSENELVISRRQGQLIEKALEEVERARLCLEGKSPLELAGDCLRVAEAYLKNCVGEDLGDEYIGQIFSQFCLGK
jgi:tRNA modification GTPase